METPKQHFPNTNVLDPITIGPLPVSPKAYEDALDEFLEIYAKRPFVDNKGGMSSAHLFYAWFMAKWIAPSHIIESGVFQGQGTWFFEQACPNAKIICLEPRSEKINYISEKAAYATADFGKIDWTDYLGENIKNTLCFFDDHQDAAPRLQTAKRYGFKHLMFEDNYPINQGDCISLKKLLETKAGQADVVRNHIESYYEFPPIAKSSHTRWGDEWISPDYPTHSPLLTEYSDKYKTYFDDAQDYTWISYVRLP